MTTPIPQRLTDDQAAHCMTALCLQWAAVTGVRGKGQRTAAPALAVNERRIRAWCAGTNSPPWAAMELLRRLIAERRATARTTFDRQSQDSHGYIVVRDQASIQAGTIRHRDDSHGTWQFFAATPPQYHPLSASCMLAILVELEALQGITPAQGVPF